jgi:hypothetical protein
MRCNLTLVSLTIAVLAVASIASAQTAPPTLQKVSPTGAQRGTRVTMTVEGTNIGGATRFIFSESGFSTTITSVKEVPIEKPAMAKGVVRTDAPIEDRAKKYEVTADVTIAPNVPHAVHAFRVETPLGVSNLLRFAVSSLAEIAEREPNQTGAAQKITLPSTSFAHARVRKWCSRWSRGPSDRVSTAPSGCLTRRDSSSPRTTTSI